MTRKLKEWEHHVLRKREHDDGAGNFTYWCGVRVIPQWHFLDKQHAENSLESYAQPCPDCRKAYLKDTVPAN